MALALEAEQATHTFGKGNSDEVILAGREALRQACHPPEKKDSETTTTDYLRLRGWSEIKIAHCGSVFSKLVKSVYCQVYGVDTPQSKMGTIAIAGHHPIRRPVNIFDSRIDRAILDRGYDLMAFTDCFREWVL